jgi:hypothetical protein
MTKRIYLTPPVVKILTATAVVLICAALIYSMSGMPAPREADRVSTLDGSISIIKPRDWTPHISYAPADQSYVTTIEIDHEGMIGLQDRLLVGRFRNAPQIDRLKAVGMMEGSFQDQPAMISSETQKRAYQWRAVFERDGQWYSVSLRLQSKEDVRNGPWWAYLTSFRCRNVPAPATAATPTTFSLPEVLKR